MLVLVTGADGFVGKWLCAELLSQGHRVIGGVQSFNCPPALGGDWNATLTDVRWVALDLEHEESVRQALGERPEAIVHLAAVASGAVARAEPFRAWAVNCLGTCALVYGMEQMRVGGRFVFASTGEVYGRALTAPARESDPVEPCSPYAGSKAGAEQALLEAHRRSGLDVVIARPFAQAGPGQRPEFVVPAFAGRLLEAKRAGSRTVTVGNLEAVREFLDVRDVCRALILLLQRGASGEVYNIAQGRGVSLRELFERLARQLSWDAEPVINPSLVRPADIPYLVGNGSRIADLGWSAERSLDTTLRDTLNALTSQPPPAGGGTARVPTPLGAA